MSKKQPIFICGHIKTGTSLMASLLDSHPELSVFPEELFLFLKYSLFKTKNLKSFDEFWYIFFNDIQIKKIFGEKASGLFGNVDYSDFNAKIFQEKCTEYTRLKPLDRDFIFHIYEAIFHSFNQNQKRWVEKTPMNEFNFFYWLNYYPNSQFIYMTRDPLEVYSSIKKKRTIENVEYSIYNFIVNYKTSQSLAKYLAIKYPKNFKILSLNHLKNDTKTVMENLSIFLNIDFTEELLKPSKLGKSWQGNSMFFSNNENQIENKLYKKERLKIVNPKEKSLIDKYLTKQKTNPFDIDFMKFSLKRYLKVVFSKLWLKNFIKKAQYS
jgi:hypothetical protein